LRLIDSLDRDFIDVRLLNRCSPIEKFQKIVDERREFALLANKLAKLRTDAPVFKKVETVRWRGPTPEFAAWAKKMKAPPLLDRVKLRTLSRGD